MNNNQLKYGVLMTYGMGILQILVNFALTAVMVRCLSNVEYGLYLLMGSIVAYISVFDFGLNNTISRYTAKYRAEGDRQKESNLITIALIMYCGVSLVIVIAGIILHGNLQYFVKDVTPENMALAGRLFSLLILNIAITLPMNSFAAILVGYEKFIYTRSVSMIRITAVPLISIPVLLLGGNSVAVVAVTTVSNILAGSANAYYAFKQLGIKLKLFYFDKEFVKELFGYSWFIFLGVLADQLMWNTGNIVLGMTQNPASVSIYGTANLLCIYFVNIISAMTGVFLPRATQLVVTGADREKLSEFLIRIGRLQAVIICLVMGGFLLLGKEFVFYWLGQSYIQVYLITIIIIFPLSLNLSKAIALSIMQAKNMHAFRSVFLIISGCANLIISYFAGKYIGIIAVAVCLSIKLFIENIILDFYYDRRVGLDVKKYYKRLSPILIPTLCAAAATFLLSLTGISSMAFFLVKGMLFIGVFFMVFWRFTSTAYEKNLITEFISGVLHKKRLKEGNDNV